MISTVCEIHIEDRGIEPDKRSHRSPGKFFGYPVRSKWARRDWTFQESLFSRRLLIFGDVVSWICGRTANLECFEDVVQDPGGPWPIERLHLGAPMGMMSLLLDLSSLGRWGMLVQHYSQRKLTHKHDSVRAFAGATDIMARTFPGGILHGLPVFFFDIAMLWQPPQRVAQRAARRLEQPSWSWTGWSGKVDCLDRWTVHFPSLFRQSYRISAWMPIAPLKAVASYRFEASQPDVTSFNDF